MSTNTVTSFSSLSEPAEYRNIESGWLNTHWREADPSNRYADNPRTAAFGQRLFFDGRFSAKEEVSRAILHLPDYYGRSTETQTALADEFYYLDPYSGGGSGTIHVCRTGRNAGGSIESLQHNTQNPNGVIGAKASVNYASTRYAC